jgi:hypothetical protein
MIEGLWNALAAAVSTRGVAIIPTSSSKPPSVCCVDFGRSAPNQEMSSLARLIMMIDWSFADFSSQVM